MVKWENLPLFTGSGRVQRDGLTIQASDCQRPIHMDINTEYNGGDVGHGEINICAKWNPVLGGLRYPPPTFRAVMRNMGASSADALDSAIASIMRA